MADLNQMGNKFLSSFRGMNTSQKLTIGMTFIITVAVFVLLLKWAMKPDYALLYSGLDLKEADQIVEALRSDNIPYRLTSGGSAVMVPSKDVYEWRVKLASQGLPSSGGIGYEVFDKKDIGISNFVQEVNYRRALEGELVRSIQGIRSIENARVHIVIPRERLFKEDQQEPTASIVISVRPGVRISENQVFGITSMVAASVEGLTPDNVTIVDTRGNVLTQAWDKDSIIGLSSNQLDLQRKVETYLSDKAESMLAGVLGSKKAIVRVSADLNFQKIERTDERYDPDNVAVLSEERTDETTTSTEGDANGQLEHTITNYNVPKTIEHITNSVGNIRRLSVAVLVDGKRNIAVDENGEESSEYIPRTDDEMNMLSAVVKNAVGFDPLRNDQFEIQNFSFDSGQTFVIEPEVNPFTQPQYWFSIGQKVLPFIFLAILLMVLRSRLKKVKLSLPPMPVLAGKQAASSGYSMDNIEVPKIDEGASPEAIENAKLTRQISEFSSEKPSLTARLLRYWMIEE